MGTVSQCANEAMEPVNPVKCLESLIHFLQEAYIKIHFWAFFGVLLCVELNVSDWSLSSTWCYSPEEHLLRMNLVMVASYISFALAWNRTNQCTLTTAIFKKSRSTQNTANMKMKYSYDDPTSSTQTANLKRYKYNTKRANNEKKIQST